MRIADEQAQATPAQVMAHAERAVDAALVYFGQKNDDFPVYVLAESPRDGAIATMTPELDYLRATLRLNVQHFCICPQTIWEVMGHEVAHLLSRELLALTDAVTKPDTLERTKYTSGIEACTCRLERMFKRDVPDPGWNTAKKAD